ncbi:hypothetical protein TanjilG_31900 [Lupinus angustifolius]|uniref:Uncharacterized protein n=1 Tax=Lupinus angustifolius TaxID=3871 RepID=A0A1J7IBU4_LUPAN|nr:hypothetical protein TanjilG_31900 [Lupinus angustifolius]
MYQNSAGKSKMEVTYAWINNEEMEEGDGKRKGVHKLGLLCIGVYYVLGFAD